MLAKLQPWVLIGTRIGLKDRQTPQRAIKLAGQRDPTLSR